MVYESDFYTTRRPYRASPSLSTYTITSEPSRQIRILPGLGKVHVVHSYDRIVPYVGHKRLTVVTSPPVVVRVRPSVLYREYDRIENKYRPFTYNSYTNDYLNSNSSVRIVYTRNPISGSFYYTDYYRPQGSTTTTTTRHIYHWPPVPRTYPRLYSYLSYPYYYPYTYSYYPFWPTTRLYSDYRPSYYQSSNYYDYLADSLLYPSKYYHFNRMFDDETRLIRAQSAALLKRVASPVPRAYRAMPLPYISSRYEDYPVRWTNDNYINKMLITSPTSHYKSDYTTYSTDPVRKYFGQGHLAAVTLVGDKAQPRRRNVYVYVEPENRHHPVMKDIELMSYYINRMKQERATKQKTMPSTVVLDPARPSRIFSVPKPVEDSMGGEIAELREQRAARLAKIMDVTQEPAPVRPKRAAEQPAEAKTKAAKDKKKKEQEEEDKKKSDEKKAKAEEAAKKEKEAQAKKDEAARKAELARQEEMAAQAAAEKAAEAERLAELARKEEAAKHAEIEKARQAEEERARLEEEKRLADEAKAEEERQQLLRLEEIARQAEEEKEGELARQADELAELARQEAELAEQAKKEEEAAEQARKAAEAEELAKQQAELEELERKEKELAEQAKAEAELAEQARLDADAAQVQAQAAQDDAAAAVEVEATPAEEAEEAPEETVAEPAAEAADNNAEASDDQSEIPADIESPAEEE